MPPDQRAAVLPHPPLLVPELAGDAAGELDPLREACLQALGVVLAGDRGAVLVGDGLVWGAPRPDAAGSFRPYGAAVDVTLPDLHPLDLDDLPEPVRLDRLPLSLAVAAFLLARLDIQPARLSALTVPVSLGPGAAAAVGRELAARAGAAGSFGLVAMGDLSARRSDRAPGAFHPAAAAFDASVGEAFRAGAPGRLLDLGPAVAAELRAAGRVPLQVLAGAFADAAGLHGEVLYEAAPYGVGYLVGVLTAP
ncbi:MAG TPA: hypothetical protein VFU54_20890 [Actinomycetota bacterium]|nr:hypothetical protein [Actinomycetota bacterium]